MIAARRCNGCFTADRFSLLPDPVQLKPSPGPHGPTLTIENLLKAGFHAFSSIGLPRFRTITKRSRIFRFPLRTCFLRAPVDVFLHQF